MQAEGVVGFYNAYQKTGERRYLEAAEDSSRGLMRRVSRSSPSTSRHLSISQAASMSCPYEKPIVEPWKCPYHNGRMCMEIMRRSAG